MNQNDAGPSCVLAQDTPLAVKLLPADTGITHNEDESEMGHAGKIAGTGSGSQQSRWLLVLGIVLVGINLRPALSSLAPILDMVRISTGMSSAAAGVLTTLPILCFGVFAPLAPSLTRFWSAERAILAGLLLLTAGIVLRVFFGVPGLFAGTLLAGASIGVVMVLLPGIIKRDFPLQAGLMTGLYTMALCLGAAAASGITVPIKELAGGDWRLALAFWALPTLLAAALWWPQLSKAAGTDKQQRCRVSGLWRSRLAWQVTMYLGLQSSLAYCVFGWLPTILIARGMRPLDAGLLLSLSIAVQLITAFGGPWLATRGRDQRFMIALALVFTTAGLMGCLYGSLGGTLASGQPGAVWWWAAILGLGQGATFSIALTLIVLRASDPHVAAALSGMAQGVGYSVAALGPLAVGILHDISGGWNSTAILFVSVAMAALIAGMCAGRNAFVDATVDEL